METAVGVGIALALGLALMARTNGLDRDRGFYSAALIAVGSYYVLFAAMAGATSALMIESAVMAGFVLAAVIGFTGSPWLLVTGPAGHGIFDLFHGSIIDNPGVPAWWPGFCAAFDVAFAGCLAWTSRRSPIAVRR